jgi:uncharacterized membrane protein
VFGQSDMLQLVTNSLLWFDAVGCGLLAGVYFAFSTFVMTALSRIEPSAGRLSHELD